MRGRIIAVSAPPGGGKSTLCAALAERLGGALVEYDAYDQMTRLPPHEVRQWLAEGGSYDRIEVPELVADLEALRAGRPIFDRLHGRELAPRALIVLETPFGRAHVPTGTLIDTSVFIDIPSDLALARKVREFIGEIEHDRAPGAPRRFVGWLDSYLDHYETLVRPAIAMQRERVMPLADLVIDGTAPLPDKVEQIVAFLIQRVVSREKANR